MKKCVFKSLLNSNIVVDLRIKRGKAFHNVGAAILNDLSPKVFKERKEGVIRTNSSLFELKLYLEDGDLKLRSSFKYSGACPFKALYVINNILKLILNLIGNQCSLISIGVIWSNLETLHINCCSNQVY